MPAACHDGTQDDPSRANVYQVQARIHMEWAIDAPRALTYLTLQEGIILECGSILTSPTSSYTAHAPEDPEKQLQNMFGNTISIVRNGKAQKVGEQRVFSEAFFTPP